MLASLFLPATNGQFRTRSSLLSSYHGKQIVVETKQLASAWAFYIFQEPASLDNYKKALEIAFAAYSCSC